MWSAGNKVFLCHSRKDRAFVNAVARDLTALGFRVWYSEWELKVGDSLLERVQSGIRVLVAVRKVPTSAG